MGSRKVKTAPVEAQPIAAQAQSPDTEQVNTAAADQARRRKGISAMYNRFGMAAAAKDKLGV